MSLQTKQSGSIHLERGIYICDMRELLYTHIYIPYTCISDTQVIQLIVLTTLKKQESEFTKLKCVRYKWNIYIYIIQQKL